MTRKTSYHWIVNLSQSWSCTFKVTFVDFADFTEELNIFAEEKIPSQRNFWTLYI